LDAILVWKLDRAFRSVAHMATAVEEFRRWGVGLRSYSEPWLDTSGTSPVADLMLNILASFAQFERSLISERVRATGQVWSVPGSRGSILSVDPQCWMVTWRL